jgi:hypothetical protein
MVQQAQAQARAKAVIVEVFINHTLAVLSTTGVISDYVCSQHHDRDRLRFAQDMERQGALRRVAKRPCLHQNPIRTKR